MQREFNMLDRESAFRGARTIQHCMAEVLEGIFGMYTLAKNQYTNNFYSTCAFGFPPSPSNSLPAIRQRSLGLPRYHVQTKTQASLMT